MFKSLHGALLAFLVIPAASGAVMGVGTGLDPSFGTGGVARINVLGESDIAWAVAIQSDGKILVGGWSDRKGYRRDATLVRLEPDGKLDATFGNKGIVSGSGLEKVDTLTVTKDGSIIAGGYQWRPGDPDMTVARFGHDGKLDQSFGTGGFTHVNAIPNAGEGVGRVVMQPDGKAVVSGSGVFRLTTAGQLDPEFRLPIIGGLRGNTAALQHDGGIVVGGTISLSTADRSRLAFTLTRCQQDGSPDTAFGENGRVTTLFPKPSQKLEWSYLSDVIVQPDGKILAIGAAYYDEVGLARYTSDGQLDTTFGQGGMARHEHGVDVQYQNAARLLDDGRILVAGAGDKFYAAIFGPNGDLIGSAVTESFATDFIEIRDVSIQDDGKIVAVGRIAPFPVPSPATDEWWAAHDFLVVRSLPIEQLVPEPASMGLMFLGTLALLRRRVRSGL